VDLLNLKSINKIENKAQYDTMIDGRKKLKKYLSTTKNSRLEITRQVDSFKKVFMDFEKQLTEPAEDILNYIEPIIQDFEEAEERERQRIYQERIQRLNEAGYSAVGEIMVNGIYQLTPDKISSMSDDEFQSWVDMGNAEKQRLEMLRQQEEQRLKEIEERERIANEKLAEANRLMAEMQAKMAELTAQEQALETAYEAPAPVTEPPMQTAPTIEFGVPEPIEPAPVEPVFTLCTESYNQGVQDAYNILKNSGYTPEGVPVTIKKSEYMEMILNLKK